MVNRPEKNGNAFTLIEAALAAVLFGILVVSTLSVVRYVGQSNEENKDALRIARELEMNKIWLRSLARQEGWETFLSARLDKTFSMGSSYILSNSNANGALAEDEWKVTISTDPALGPYLKQVSNNGSEYALTFSSPVYAKVRDMNLLIPVINSSAVQWTNETVTVPFLFVPPGTTGVTIGSTGSQVTGTGGYRIRPTANVVDAEERADITYKTGVQIPSSGNATGYPALVKLRFQTLRSGSTLYYNDVLSAE